MSLFSGKQESQTVSSDSPKTRKKSNTVSSFSPPPDLSSSQGDLGSSPRKSHVSSRLKEELTKSIESLQSMQNLKESSKKDDHMAMLEFIGISKEMAMKKEQSGGSPSDMLGVNPQVSRSKTKAFSIEQKKANGSLTLLPTSGNASRQLTRGGTALALIGGVDNSQTSPIEPPFEPHPVMPTSSHTSSKHEDPVESISSSLHNLQSSTRPNQEPRKTDQMAMLEFMGISNPETAMRRTDSADIMTGDLDLKTKADRLAIKGTVRTKAFSIEQKKATDAAPVVLPESGNASRKIVRGATALALIGGIDNSADPSPSSPITTTPSNTLQVPK